MTAMEKIEAEKMRLDDEIIKIAALIEEKEEENRN